MNSMTDVGEATRKLAGYHFANDPDTKQIFSLPSEGKIRLIEVTDSVGTTGEVLSFEFGPDAKNLIPFPSEIILISPQEWEMIRAKRLPLPPTWDIERLEPVPRAS